MTRLAVRVYELKIRDKVAITSPFHIIHKLNNISSRASFTIYHHNFFYVAEVEAFHNLFFFFSLFRVALPYPLCLLHIH